MITPDFFKQETLELAKSLLGMELVHETAEGTTAGMIVEVEAYRGPLDKAAHSYGGKMTERTRAMFGPPGHAYVYFIYGMHYCMNVVSAEEGAPEAVLIRALQPVSGIRLMGKRRGLDLPENSDIQEIPRRTLQRLTAGPARLCQAMGIDKKQYGLPLNRPPLYLRHYRDPIPKDRIASGPRINIDYAEEAKEYPWRFWIKDNPFVSK
ncbi:MAG: DNA-3-methyladenine glycosylase [Bacillaceae bacterium]|nr:DNA-3-methyladenine glycosylase [Bacillaceae bacterium]